MKVVRGRGVPPINGRGGSSGPPLPAPSASAAGPRLRLRIGAVMLATTVGASGGQAFAKVRLVQVERDSVDVSVGG